MKQTGLTEKAQTVLGAIDADSLGVTLPHEHLLIDATIWCVEPAEATEKALVHQPVCLENLWWIRTHSWGYNIDDSQLLDEQVAIKEALLYKLAGGNTIVELSNIGLARDPLGLARIARATGLNIIMGAGYYIGPTHPAELANKSEEEIAQRIVRDIIVGVGDTGVKAGIIGEIGCSTPLQEGERKVLRASAIAQRHTGAAINIHNEYEKQALEITEILSDAGADLSRTVLSHVAGWGDSPASLPKLLEAGCYLEYDFFGQDVVSLSVPLEGRVIDMPSDAQSINSIIQLIDEGYLNQILVSHDVGLKHLLTTYGGFGYAHILRDVVPVMRMKGMSDEQIHTLLVDNPKRFLSFAPVKD
ncbi:phosphotriesterase [Chloroflexota bacterium]